MKRFSPRILWGILIATLLSVALAWAWTSLQGGAKLVIQVSRESSGTLLADYGAVPDFELNERSGESFSLSALRGRPWIANFIFTRCSGQCPRMSLEMSRLQKELADPELRFVSFTVDPEFDTPEVLAKYADRYEADKNRWFFLTGSKEAVNQLTRAFHMNPVDEPAFHSLRFVLVDRDARIRGYYDSSDQEALKKLSLDLQKVPGQVPGT